MLTNPPVLDFSLVKARADLDERADIIREVINISKEMRESSRNPTERFGQALSQRMLDKKTREEALASFKQKVDPVQSQIIELRELEVSKIEKMLWIVQFMSNKWGKWTYDCATDKVLFTETSIANDYTKALKEVEEMENRAKQLQAQVKSGFQSK
jgi:hypothetical protein